MEPLLCEFPGLGAGQKQKWKKNILINMNNPTYNNAI